METIFDLRRQFLYANRAMCLNAERIRMAIARTVDPGIAPERKNQILDRLHASGAEIKEGTRYFCPAYDDGENST